MDPKDFDIEIQDKSGNSPVHYNGTITTAGSPTTITPSNTISQIFIQNPSKGPNANSSTNAVLLISVDGGVTYISIERGASISISGYFTSLKIDTNTNGTKYEAIVWS